MPAAPAAWLLYISAICVEKIEIDPSNPRYLKVVWGLGYKIEKEAKQ